MDGYLTLQNFHFGLEEEILFSFSSLQFLSVSQPEEAYCLSENLENKVVKNPWITFDGVFCSNEYPQSIYIYMYIYIYINMKITEQKLIY